MGLFSIFLVGSEHDGPITATLFEFVMAGHSRPKDGVASRISISIARGSCVMAYGHFTSGGIDDRMESTLPPVFSPKMVPRS
jgi:hypothetical protein